MKSCLPPQTLLNIFQQCSVFKWLSACLVSCLQSIRSLPCKTCPPSGPLLAVQGPYCQGAVLARAASTHLSCPPSQATHPRAPCEPFHPHGSDLPARVLCVPAPPLADTCRDSCLHLLASLASVCVLLSYMVCVPAQARV